MAGISVGGTRILVAAAAQACVVALAGCAVTQQRNADLRPGTNPVAEQEVLAAEAELLRAALTNDAALVERLEAPDLVATSAGGKLSTRADDLADARAAAISYIAPIVDEARVRIYGNTAISTFHIKYTYEYRGKSAHRERRYTNTWIRADRGWQLVASHYSTYGDSTGR